MQISHVELTLASFFVVLSFCGESLGGRGFVMIWLQSCYKYRWIELMESCLLMLELWYSNGRYSAEKSMKLEIWNHYYKLSFVHRKEPRVKVTLQVTIRLHLQPVLAQTSEAWLELLTGDPVASQKASVVFSEPLVSFDIVLDPRKALESGPPSQNFFTSCTLNIVTWHDMTWHDMTWHDWLADFCCLGMWSVAFPLLSSSFSVWVMTGWSLWLWFFC